MDEAIEEGPGGDDGGAGHQPAAIAEFQAQDAAMGAGGAGHVGGSAIPGLRSEIRGGGGGGGGRPFSRLGLKGIPSGAKAPSDFVASMYG